MFISWIYHPTIEHKSPPLHAFWQLNNYRFLDWLSLSNFNVLVNRSFSHVSSFIFFLSADFYIPSLLQYIFVPQVWHLLNSSCGFGGSAAYINHNVFFYIWIDLLRLPFLFGNNHIRWLRSNKIVRVVPFSLCESLFSNLVCSAYNPLLKLIIGHCSCTYLLAFHYIVIYVFTICHLFLIISFNFTELRSNIKKLVLSQIQLKP